MLNAKKLSGVLFLTLSGSVLASSAYAEFSPVANFNGFYAGVDAGGLFSQGNLNTKQSATFLEPNMPVPQNTRTLSASHTDLPYKDSLAGNIHVGYGHALGQTPIYLGAEVFGNLADHNLGLSYVDSMGESVSAFNAQSIQSINIKLNDAEYGVDVRPGLFVTPSTLLFARVGVAFNEIQANANSTFVIANNFTHTVTTTTLPVNASKNVAGLRLGGGIEERIGSHWGVSANYIYTNYGNINLSGVTNTINDIGTMKVGGFTTQIGIQHLVSQAAMLGINYYFDPTAEGTGEFWYPDYLISPAAFNGFSATISGGMLQDRAAMQINTSATFAVGAANIETIETDTQSPRAAKDTGIGAISVGYGHLLGGTSLYLGGDMYVSLGNQTLLTHYHVNDSILHPNNSPGDLKKVLGSVRVHLNSVEWGGDIRPGVLLGPRTLLYGRVGFARNIIGFSANKKFEFIDASTDPNTLHISTLSVGTSKAVTGLRLGAGLEEYIGQHLSLNFDYIYTDFGRVHLSGVGQLTSSVENEGPIGMGAVNAAPLDIVTTNGLVNNSQAHVTSQAIMVGLTYHLGSPSPPPSCPVGYKMLSSQ